jgi:hypothetical protein
MNDFIPERKRPRGKASNDITVVLVGLLVISYPHEEDEFEPRNTKDLIQYLLLDKNDET